MFDTLQFLKENFTSPTELIALLRAYRKDAPPYDTVYAWFRRGTVPNTWLPLLVCYLELERGGPVSLTKYIKGDV